MQRLGGRTWQDLGKDGGVLAEGKCADPMPTPAGGGAGPTEHCGKVQKREETHVHMLDFRANQSLQETRRRKKIRSCCHWTHWTLP